MIWQHDLRSDLCFLCGAVVFPLMKPRKSTLYLTRCPIPKASARTPTETGTNADDVVVSGGSSGRSRLIEKRANNLIEEYDEFPARCSQKVIIQRPRATPNFQKPRIPQYKNGEKPSKKSKRSVVRTLWSEGTANVAPRISAGRHRHFIQPPICEPFNDEPLVKSDVIFDEPLSQEDFLAALPNERCEFKWSSILNEKEQGQFSLYHFLDDCEDVLVEDRGKRLIDPIVEEVEIESSQGHPSFTFDVQRTFFETNENTHSCSVRFSPFPVLPPEVRRQADKHIPGGLAARLASITKEDLADQTFWKNKQLFLRGASQNASSSSIGRPDDGDMPPCLILQILKILHTEGHLLEVECRMQRIKSEDSQFSFSSLAGGGFSMGVVFEKSHFEAAVLGVGAVFALMKPWISVRTKSKITIFRPYFIRTTAPTKLISLLD